MIPRRFCLSVAISIPLVLGSLSNAQSKSRAELIARLDEEKIVDTALTLLISSAREKRVYYPVTVDVSLDDTFEFLRGSTNTYQYARSFITRYALHHLPVIERVKSPEDFNEILRFVGFGVLWSSDTMTDTFGEFLRRSSTPLVLRLRTMLAVLKGSEQEMQFMPIPRRNNRLNKIRSMINDLFAVRAPESPGIPVLKEQISQLNRTLTQKFCEEKLRGNHHP